MLVIKKQLAGSSGQCLGRSSDGRTKARLLPVVAAVFIAV